MRSPKRLAIPAVVAALVTALSACSGGDGGGDTIRLATGVDPSFTAVFVAEDQGFFEEHGVNVEVSKLEGGPAMAQAVTAGQADMATQSDATTVTLMATDPKLRAIADFQHSTTYIKVVWGPNVSEPGDIKKLATLPGVMTLATVRYLESQNIDPESVELVNASPPDVPVMMDRGDVDGTVIYEPWATRSAEDSGGQVVGSIGDFDLSYAQWLVTSSDWLADHETEAAGVAAALDEANQFIKANPEEAQAIIERALNIPVDQTAQVMQDLVFESRDISSETLAQEKKTAQFFVDEGTVAAMPDLDKQILVDWYSEHQ